MSLTDLTRIVTLFSAVSLLSIGGGNSVIPELHLRSVQDFHWMTNGQFADIFAIAQAAPGPSMLIVTLIGYKAAGIPGAILATICMILPAGMLVYWFSRKWHSAAGAWWHRAFEVGLAPLAVGLILASGVIVARSADHSWQQILLTCVATVIFIRTKWSPIWVVGAAGLLGFLGWV